MLKNDLGFVIPILENNNFGIHICQIIKKFIDQYPKYNFCIFNQYCETPDTQNVPLLPLSHARYFHGNLILFDIGSLLLASNFPTIEKIYFYTNASPWVSSYNNYYDWREIFDRKNIKIISNNQEIHDIYNIIWNNSLGVAETVSYESLSKFVC